MAQSADYYEQRIIINADGSLSYQYFSVRWVYTGTVHTVTGQISEQDLSYHPIGKPAFDKAVKSGAKVQTSVKIHRSIPVEMFPPIWDPSKEA